MTNRTCPPSLAVKDVARARRAVIASDHADVAATLVSARINVLAKTKETVAKAVMVATWVYH